MASEYSLAYFVKNMRITIEDKIEELGFEEVIIFENPDYEDAFIGVSDEGRAVYDYDLMVKCLMEEDDMDELEAREFIDYNTLRAIPYFGNKAPIVLYSY